MVASTPQTSRLYLFGSPRLEHLEATVELETRKAMALLAYLAVSNREQRRETLAALLWPEQDSAQARSSLRRALYMVRQATGDDILISTRQTVAIGGQDILWVDVRAFVTVTSRLDTSDGTKLAAAADIYTQDFLAGFTLPDCAEFDQWQLFQTEELRRRQSEILTVLSSHHRAQGETIVALDYARRRLALDLLDEEAHRLAMQLYADAGQKAAALRQYEECKRILAQELDVPPSAETNTLYEQIRQGSVGTIATSPVEPVIARTGAAQARVNMPPTTPSQPGPLHNLPAAPTAFLGRRQELATLAGQLADPQVRLLTVMGPGGMGKTRLAQEAARQALDSHADGVWFVPLAPVSAVEYIVPAIGSALGITFHGNVNPQEYLLSYLRDKELLLVLDNFEHLLDGTDLVTDLLQAVARLQCLVTSRERLSLQEEWVLDLQGLDYPLSAGADNLAQYAAIQLFVGRAAHLHANFGLNDDNRADIVRICRFVQGMPLGLELAAGWIRTISVPEIAHEIERGIDVLATSLRNVPDRHRSLRAVFDQSWKMLSGQEQETFAKLSIFHGGCLRHAAQQVAGASMPLLASLMDKSLLQYEPDGRYQVHELLRQYGAERLRAQTETAGQTERAHATYYADFLQRSEAQPNQKIMLDDISAELDNIRAAWHWIIEHDEVDLLDQSLHALWLFCELRSNTQENLTLFDRAITHLRSGVPFGADMARHNTILGRLLARRAWLSIRASDQSFAQATEMMEEGLVYLRQAPDDLRQDIVFILRYYASIIEFLGEPQRAEEVLNERMQLAYELGNDHEEAITRYYLAQMREFQGKYRQAAEIFSDILPLLQEAGDDYSSYTLNNWGRALYGMGEYSHARTLIEEAHAMRQELDTPVGLGYSLLDLGRLAEVAGDYVEANSLMEEALAIAQDHAQSDTMARCLNGLGAVARQSGDLERAEACHRRSLALYRRMETVIHVPVSLNGLGAVAYARAEFIQARAYFLQSSELCERMDHVGRSSEAAVYLARCALAMGAEDEIAGRLRYACTIGVEHGAAPVALDTVIVAGEWWQHNRPERAVELLSFAARHPAARYESRQRAQTLLQQISQSPPLIEQPGDLWQVAGGLLDELV